MRDLEYEDIITQIIKENVFKDAGDKSKVWTEYWHYVISIVHQERDKICQDWGIPDIKIEWEDLGSGTNAHFARKVKPLLNVVEEYWITMSTRLISQGFSINEILKTLRHELAHYIHDFMYPDRYLDNSYYIYENDFSHGADFRDICLMLGGSMNKHFATGKWKPCLGNKWVK